MRSIVLKRSAFYEFPFTEIVRLASLYNSTFFVNEIKKEIKKNLQCKVKKLWGNQTNQPADV